MKKILSLVAVASIVIGISNTAYAKNSYNVNRLYGADRYKTSVSISNNFNSGTVQNVIVASGQNFPDALAGSVLSKKYNAPILLLSDTLAGSSDSIDYIKAHLDKSGHIYVLGGEASVGTEFINQMKTEGYNNIVRLGGKNRFDTNKFIVDSMNLEKGTPVVITNGYGFADALSVSSVASIKGYPILMTDASKLPDETKNILSTIQPSQVYVIGGTGAVSDDVINEIKTIVPSLASGTSATSSGSNSIVGTLENLVSSSYGNKIIRIAGQTRYDTSLEICKYFNLETDDAVLANGQNFPDALSGSALASKLSAPIILTNGQDLTKQQEFIDSKSYKNLILLGGLGSIDLPIEYSLKDPSQISSAEKAYINSLSNYCSDYITESTNSSNYMTKLLNDNNVNNDLANVTDPTQLSAIFGKYSQTFKDGNTSLETYKQKLIKLKSDASSLQSPAGLESLKLDYINNIDTEIKSLETLKSYIDTYANIFDSIKTAFNSLDMNTVQAKFTELESFNDKYISNLKNLPSGETNIKNLSDRLTKIKNSMQ